LSVCGEAAHTQNAVLLEFSDGFLFHLLDLQEDRAGAARTAGQDEIRADGFHKDPP
jgi:hypothetical protein